METLLQPPVVLPPEENISPRARLVSWSKDARLLSGIAGGVIAIALVVAWFTSGQETTGHKLTQHDLAGELKDPHPDPGSVFLAISHSTGLGSEGEESIKSAIEKSALDPNAKLVASAYWDTVQSELPEPGADLIYYAHYIRPLPFANELIGDLYAAARQNDRAANYYSREFKLFDSKSARAKLIPVLLAKHDLQAARSLAADQSITSKLTLQERLDIMARTRRWNDLAATVLELDKSLLKPVPLLLAIVAGLTWLAVLLHAIQPQSPRSFRVIVPLFAVCAGIASATPTLFAAAWQQEMWGFAQTGDLFKDLPMYLLGVGPREELIKLLFCLPFVPFLVIRKNRLEMLIIPACIGLGFGLAENLLYFAQLGPAAALGRCLLSNFLHLSMTGLIGFAFCEWLGAPVKKAPLLLATLAAVILAHGLFDALLPLRIKGFSPSMIIFSVLAIFFFRCLSVHRAANPEEFSMSATLVIGISILTATVIITSSALLGFFSAFWLLIISAITLFMVVVMFHFQLTEAMEENAAVPTEYT